MDCRFGTLIGDKVTTVRLWVASDHPHDIACIITTAAVTRPIDCAPIFCGKPCA